MICKYIQSVECLLVVYPLPRQDGVGVFMDSIRLNSYFLSENASAGLETARAMMEARFDKKISLDENGHDSSLVLLPDSRILIVPRDGDWFEANQDDYQALMLLLRANGVKPSDEPTMVSKSDNMDFNQLKAIVEHASAVPETA